MPTSAFRQMESTYEAFVPVHPRDFCLLPYCIAALQRFARPQLQRITLVMDSRQTDKLPIEVKGIVHILDEATVVGLPAFSSIVPIVVHGVDRTRWYYQQLVKFALRHHTDHPHYLVMDADTVLIRPTRFLDRSGRPCFYRSLQHHLPYFSTYERLLGEPANRSPSFIVDYMVFTCEWLDALLLKIESRSTTSPWNDCILDVIDRTETSSYSEYETYGYFVMSQFPGKYDSVRINYRDMSRQLLPLSFWQISRLRWQGVRSLSFHHYL